MNPRRPLLFKQIEVPSSDTSNYAFIILHSAFSYSHSINIECSITCNAILIFIKLDRHSFIDLSVNNAIVYEIVFTDVCKYRTKIRDTNQMALTFLIYL